MTTTQKNKGKMKMRIFALQCLIDKITKSEPKKQQQPLGRSLVRYCVAFSTLKSKNSECVIGCEIPFRSQVWISTCHHYRCSTFRRCFAFVSILFRMSFVILQQRNRKRMKKWRNELWEEKKKNEKNREKMSNEILQLRNGQNEREKQNENYASMS